MCWYVFTKVVEFDHQLILNCEGKNVQLGFVFAKAEVKNSTISVRVIKVILLHGKSYKSKNAGNCQYLFAKELLFLQIRSSFSFNLASLLDPFDVLFSQVKLWTPTPPRDVSANSYPVITLAKDCLPNTY